MSDQAAAAALREPWEDLAEQRRASSFGFWIFITSEILFFGAFFMAYAYLRTLHPDAFKLASSHSELLYGTINTGLLLTSSLTMGLAVSAASLDLRRISLRLLAATVALGCMFLVVKGLEYKSDIDEGLFPVPGHTFPIDVASAQLFFAAYWMITVVHVIHLSIGIGVVAVLAWRIHRGRLPLASPQFEITALYWSFVDMIWVMLYPLIYLGGR
jgi:cytochrome c oxidase subunit III